MKECMIITRKEYEALRKENLELKLAKNTLEIKWGYTINRGGYYIDNAGTLGISNGLWKQIRAITQSINDKVIDTMNESDEKMAKRFQRAKLNVIEAFKELPWYKRLWFNSKYIKL